MSKNKILKEYSAHAPRLEKAFESLRESLNRLIGERGLKIHSVTGRIKSLSGLEQKVSRPDRSYESLSEITDLLAFRIITYSEDAIERVADLIEQSFNVDFSNSTNKLRHQDHQRFGYRSLHYVCSAPSDGSLKFEVQIRTLLQHGWAEFEHGIGYKAGEELPGEFRRRFSQIASLLEIADREFVALQSDIAAYKRRLNDIDFDGSQKIGIDLLSLQTVLQKEPILELDAQVAAFLKLPLSDDLFFPDYLLRVLHAAGLTKVGEVLEEARHARDNLAPFLETYFEFAQGHWSFERSSIKAVGKGYGLLFAAHLALLRQENLLIDKLNRMTRFYQQIDYPNAPEKAKAVSHALISRLQRS